MSSASHSVDVNAYGNEVVLTQRSETNDGEQAIRVAYDQIADLCDRIYFARKKIEENHNAEQRQKEREAELAETSAKPIEK